MEKIQSALAKARAARGEVAAGRPSISTAGTVLAGAAQERGPAPPPPAPSAGAAAPTSEERSDDRLQLRRDADWAGLRGIDVATGTLERAHIVAAKGGAAAAAFDVMRTKLLHQMRANGWRRVAVTSPGAACGKSTVALNLAFSLARQADLRVVLVEMDLHRPTLARTLRFAPVGGVADVLDGAIDATDGMVRYGANLAMLPSAGSRRNPADLFQAPRTAEVLDGIERQFDPTVMIFDMPPMLIGDDVMAFMGHVDCAMLIAAAETTTIKEIDACERELATRTNVMGVVLNKCRYLGKDQSYGYYD